MKTLERLKELCARDEHGGLIYIGDFYSVAAHAVPALIELVEAQRCLINAHKNQLACLYGACGASYVFRDEEDQVYNARAKIESLEV